MHSKHRYVVKSVHNKRKLYRVSHSKAMHNKRWLYRVWRSKATRDSVMLLALCPQVVSQTPQLLRYSERKATCYDCFARRSVCSVISLDTGMSRAVHHRCLPRRMSNMDTGQSGFPIPLLPFCSNMSSNQERLVLFT